MNAKEPHPFVGEDHFRSFKSDDFLLCALLRVQLTSHCLILCCTGLFVTPVCRHTTDTVLKTDSEKKKQENL